MAKQVYVGTRNQWIHNSATLRGDRSKEHPFYYFRILDTLYKSNLITFILAQEEINLQFSTLRLWRKFKSRVPIFSVPHPQIVHLHVGKKKIRPHFLQYFFVGQSLTRLIKITCCCPIWQPTGSYSIAERHRRWHGRSY